MKKAMKTIAAVVCAALTLSFVACQKSPEELIIGTWNEDEATWTTTIGDQTMSGSMLEEDETVEMTFNADKTYTTLYHAHVGGSSGGWVDSEDSGTWSIADGKLTTVDDGTPVTFTIDKLDKKVCNLTYTESGTEDGETYSSTIVIKMTRKK